MPAGVHTRSLAAQDRPTLLIGVSAALRRIDEEARELARSDAKVLVTGETGVGKDLVARLLHHYSPRRAGPFVALNCVGIPDSLLESELFGHLRGSFTGAYRDRKGLLEQAHGGTILLDEVGEMSPRMQAVLLRFLDDGEVRRVGAATSHRVTDVRVVAATHRILPNQIAVNEFREDLYYRLNVAHLAVPPLRDRPDDIEPLLRCFLQTFSERYRLPAPRLDREALAEAMAFNWPGNVRQLRNAAERLVVLGCGTTRVTDLAKADALRSTVRSAAMTPAAFPGAATCLLTLRAVEPFERMVAEGESFWTAVFPLFMGRDLTREDLQSIVRAGLERAGGSFRGLAQLFNIDRAHHKRFMGVLDRHQCRKKAVRSGSAGLCQDPDRAA